MTKPTGKSAEKQEQAAKKILPPADSLSFEAALLELETIVSRLERGDVPLEQSIAIYERGESLKKQCEKLLRAAEDKIEKIRLSPEGEPQGTESLD